MAWGSLWARTVLQDTGDGVSWRSYGSAVELQAVGSGRRQFRRKADLRAARRVVWTVGVAHAQHIITDC